MEQREFVLTDGNKFIKCDINGNYKQVNNICVADVYESQGIATNIMLNSIPKSLSRKFYVAELVNGNIIQCNSPRPPKSIRPKSKQTYRFDSCI